MLRRTRVVITSLVSVPFLASATAFHLPATAAPSKTITYWTYQSQAAAVDRILIRGFEATHPGVKVDFQLIPSLTTYFEKVATALSAGNPPDVWDTAPDYFYQFIDRGQLLNLLPYAHSLGAQTYFKGFLGELAWPPHSATMYGMPHDWVVGELFYNKNAFRKAGVPFPTANWTWTDLAAAAKKLTLRKGKVVQQVGFQMSSGAQLDVFPAIQANGGKVLNANRTKFLLTSPTDVRTLQFFTNLVKHGYASPPSTAQIDPFLSGKVAMEVEGSWDVASLVKQHHFQWGVAPMPKGSQGRVTYGGPDLEVASKVSRYPKLDWEFIHYITSNQRAVPYFIQAPGLVPYYKGFLPKVPLYHSAWLRVAEESAGVARNAFTPNYGQWLTDVEQALQGAYLGKESVKAAARQAASLGDTVLASNPPAPK